MRDAAHDWRKALKILGEHYVGKGKCCVNSLSTEPTSWDHHHSSEKCWWGSEWWFFDCNDLKGLPGSFKPFFINITQNDTKITFVEFKAKEWGYRKIQCQFIWGQCDENKWMKGTERENYNVKLTCYSCGQKGQKAMNVLFSTKSRNNCAGFARAPHTKIQTVDKTGKTRKVSGKQFWKTIQHLRRGPSKQYTVRMGHFDLN